MPVQVIPVLDVKAGRAVHAVGGERAHYQPLRSVLHESSSPLALALAYRERFGFRQLYVADLDAIAGGAPNLDLYRELASPGIELLVDAGIRDRAMVSPLSPDLVATVVVGLETVRGRDALAAIVDDLGPRRLVFSLDLRQGIPVTSTHADWQRAEPEAIAEAVLALGVSRLLLLDLSCVGRGRGIGTLPLLARLALAHPEAEITVGGGIGGPADLAALDAAGASCVLVGSALHDGRIRKEDLPVNFQRGTSETA